MERKAYNYYLGEQIWESRLNRAHGEAGSLLRHLRGGLPKPCPHAEAQIAKTSQFDPPGIRNWQ